MKDTILAMLWIGQMETKISRTR